MRWSNSPTHPCNSSFVLIAGYNPFFYSQADHMKCRKISQKTKAVMGSISKKRERLPSPHPYSIWLGDTRLLERSWKKKRRQFWFQKEKNDGFKNKDKFAERKSSVWDERFNDSLTQASDFFPNSTLLWLNIISLLAPRNQKKPTLSVQRVELSATGLSRRSAGWSLLSIHELSLSASQQGLSRASRASEVSALLFGYIAPLRGLSGSPAVAELA